MVSGATAVSRWLSPTPMAVVPGPLVKVGLVARCTSMPVAKERFDQRTATRSGAAGGTAAVTPAGAVRCTDAGTLLDQDEQLTAFSARIR